MIPTYLSLTEARTELERIGVKLTPRQIKRAADMDAHGRRKLPFFVDPITKQLRIEKGALVAAYRKPKIEAENNLQDCARM